MGSVVDTPPLNRRRLPVLFLRVDWIERSIDKSQGESNHIQMSMVVTGRSNPVDLFFVYLGTV